jgi:hypothetical protein
MKNEYSKSSKHSFWSEGSHADLSYHCMCICHEKEYRALATLRNNKWLEELRKEN